MTSEIRVNSIKNRSGLSTVTWNDEGIEVVGIATAIELDVSGNATIGGNLGVVGTLTYEDVTRVDALGLSTYREGLHVGPHASIGATVYKDGSIRTSGIITAASFVGDGSGLTGAGPSLANGSNDRVVTATGANALTGEANLTFTGSILTVTNGSGASELTLVTPSANDSGVYFNDGSNAGALSYNHSDNSMRFRVNATEKLRITSAGNLGIGDASPTTPLTVGTATPVVLLDDQSSRTLEIRGPSTTHNATILTTSNHALLLGTNNTERIRIQNSGNVGINDNDASYRLNVAGDNTASNGAGMLKGIIGVQNNTTAFGSSPTAGISFQTKYRSSPDVPLDVAAIYGGKENTSDADKDGYLGFAVREEGGSGTYEKMRLTSSGGLQLNGYNYIESCELRLNANNSIQSTSDAIKFATRFNTDSSLISINHSGGTGSGTRITFTKAVYVLVTVSQDVLGNSDTSYWSQKLVTNGGIQGYHLIRRTTQWDNMAWSEGVSIPANGWLEIQWNGTNGLTNADADSWSHYHFLVWQNV